MALAVGLASSLALAACGGEGGSTGSDAAQDTDSEQTAAWSAGGGEQWEDLLKKAREEGSVSVAGPPPLAEPMAAAFKRDTGITLNWLGLNSRDLSNRLEQEATSQNVTIDLSFGGGSELTRLLPEGRLEPLAPQLVLPEAGPENWQGGKLKWLDNKGQYMLQTTNWVHAWVIVNTNKVKPDELKTTEDLLSPRFTGKIAAYDPTSGGQGQSAAAYYARVRGLDYVRKLYKDQKTTLTQDGRQLVEWIARGTYEVGLGAIAPDVARFQKQGLPVGVVILEDAPGSLTGGFSVLKQPVGVPHPSAAQVFLNWYAAGPGLEVYSNTMVETPLRTDVQLPAGFEYLTPQPGANYLDQYQEDYYIKERPKVTAALRELLGAK